MSDFPSIAFLPSNVLEKRSWKACSFSCLDLIDHSYRVLTGVYISINFLVDNLTIRIKNDLRQALLDSAFPILGIHTKKIIR